MNYISDLPFDGGGDGDFDNLPRSVMIKKE